MADIEIRKLSKSFRVEGREHHVLEDLELTVPANRITVLLGKSGCGKTTLLRLISGLDKDYTGTVSIPEDSKMAFVFQEARLMPWLTVRQNIAFGLKKKEIDEEEIERLIKLTGLEGFADAMPRQLSGGMSQRTALARALALHPQFILMDEPFAALDYFTREKMQQALLSIHETTGCGVLFVTHSIDEALAVGDRIVILDEKKVKKVFDFDKGARSLWKEEQRQALREDILDSIQFTQSEIIDAQDYRYSNEKGEL